MGLVDSAKCARTIVIVLANRIGSDNKCLQDYGLISGCVYPIKMHQDSGVGRFCKVLKKDSNCTCQQDWLTVPVLSE